MTKTPHTSVLTKLRAQSPKRGLLVREALGIAERQATQLLALSSIESEPVPMEVLSYLPRVQLSTEEGLPSSGASFWDGDNWQLVANAGEHTHRQRFSLAHEYKHVIDHPLRDLLYPSHAVREQVADHFAACLLMPRRLVTRAWCSGEQDLDTLAELFAVSPAAMERRLLTLGHLQTRRLQRYLCTRGLRTDRRFAMTGYPTTKIPGRLP